MTLDIVGTWKLVSYETQLEDGQVVKPWEDDFLGYALITNEGYLSASIVRTNVDDETAKESFFSYTGRYEIEGNRSKTLVELCSDPSWVGSVQERIMEVDGDLFTAIIPSMEWEGIKGRFCLTWKRV